MGHKLAQRCSIGVVCIIALVLCGTFISAADKLPSQLGDGAFWKMVSDFSEPSGYFPYENLLSNEVSYQSVIPQLIQMEKTGGVYLGVGPEQNFSYIAALQPKIAFIIDIRRQNMLELLMYKALFETSRNRGEFVSKLFSRRPAMRVDDWSTAGELFQAIEHAEPSWQLFDQTAEGIREHLVSGHRFNLSSSDWQTIERILGEFLKSGPRMDFGFTRSSPAVTPPTYSELMTATDFQGHGWSYLATEENFQRVRQMQQRNMIIPLVGDFGGKKTLLTVARYLLEHQSTVTAFYVSNVEQYLEMDKPKRLAFRSNVAALPLDSSSTFIRFTPPSSTTLAPMLPFLEQGKSKLWQLLRVEPFD
jgi:hypothetical protein